MALAIDGGRPVRDELLPYGRQSLDEADIAACVDVLRSPWLTTGPRIAEFEGAVADYAGAAHAVAFSSGTSALHAAAAAAGLGPGDEAITTPLTFAATANCVAYQGAQPVFADIHANTLNISAEEIERRITPRTKAILPVDFAGLPADLDAIMDVAERHGLLVIEDAAHALGATHGGRHVGSISHMTVFSFHPVKQITTAEGGMVLTDRADLAERLRRFRNHGIVYTDKRFPWNYEIPELGYNYRITDIQCALGVSQLTKLDGFVDRRNVLARRYASTLAESSFLELPDANGDARHAWHLFVVLLELERLSVGRDEVMEAMRAENIGVQLHYPLVHLQPYYRERWGYGDGDCPVAEALSPRLMTIPLFPAMTEADQDQVVEALDKVLGSFTSS